MWGAAQRLGAGTHGTLSDPSFGEKALGQGQLEPLQPL